MENHPIPQDVTGFQFKLIGDMTIKQFAYLAAGCVLAYIFFSLPFLAIIKLPLSFLSLLFGMSLAFLPIEGRPMDVMLSNYIKALFVPNLYLYQKVGGRLSPPHLTTKSLSGVKKTPTPINREKLKVYFQGQGQRKKSPLDEREALLLESLVSIFASGMPNPPQTPTPTILTLDEITKALPKETLWDKEKEEEKIKEVLEKEAINIQTKLEEVKEEEKQPGVNLAQIHQKVFELEQQLNDTLRQKQQLEAQLLALQQKLGAQRKETFVPTTAKPVPAASQHVRKIPKELERKIGAPITADAPNLITGVVKDPRGNILPNILIEVKDKEGNPVRAFKTNPLGQFASATPLANGLYTIEFEDPTGRNKFDLVEIATSGETLMPLEVVSTDEREELRRSLFGDQV